MTQFPAATDAFDASGVTNIGQLRHVAHLLEKPDDRTSTQLLSDLRQATALFTVVEHDPEFLVRLAASLHAIETNRNVFGPLAMQIFLLVQSSLGLIRGEVKFAEPTQDEGEFASLMRRIIWSQQQMILQSIDDDRGHWAGLARTFEPAA